MPPAWFPLVSSPISEFLLERIAKPQPPLPWASQPVSVCMLPSSCDQMRKPSPPLPSDSTRSNRHAFAFATACSPSRKIPEPPKPWTRRSRSTVRWPRITMPSPVPLPFADTLARRSRSTDAKSSPGSMAIPAMSSAVTTSSVACGPAPTSVSACPPAPIAAHVPPLHARPSRQAVPASGPPLQRPEVPPRRYWPAGKYTTPPLRTRAEPARRERVDRRLDGRGIVAVVVRPRAEVHHVEYAASRRRARARRGGEAEERGEQEPPVPGAQTNRAARSGKGDLARHDPDRLVPVVRVRGVPRTWRVGPREDRKALALEPRAQRGLDRRRGLRPGDQREVRHASRMGHPGAGGKPGGSVASPRVEGSPHDRALHGSYAERPQGFDRARGAGLALR